MSAILASIPGRDVLVADAVRRSILHDEKFLKNAIEEVLVRDYAARHGFTNSDEELQVASDELRYQRGLESVEKLKAWMAANHQTVMSLQDAIDYMLLRNKIRNQIGDAEIAAYYAEHELDFEKVELYSCRLQSEDKARELHASIQDEGANFNVVAMEHSTDSETRPRGGHIGTLARGQMTGEVEAAVFHAKPGQIIGPVKTEKGWNLFLVSSHKKTSLAEASLEIRGLLFENLIAKLQSEAGLTYPVLEETAHAAH